MTKHDELKALVDTMGRDNVVADDDSEPVRINWLNGRRVDEMSCSAAAHLPNFVRYPEASKRATQLRAAMQPVDLDEPGDGRRIINAIALQLGREGYRRADGRAFDAKEITSLFYTNHKADALAAADEPGR